MLKITEADVGNYIIDEHGVAWKVISYDKSPTFTIHNAANNQEITLNNHQMSSLDYKRLVKEG